MIVFKQGNIFESDAAALVNTVNCVGIMGKGIAHQFARAYPLMYATYVKDCKRGAVKLGQVLSYRESGRLIINFPTKDHWKSNSRIESIKLGLKDLVREIIASNIRSIAIPPLGCGNGGLSWSEVKPLIEDAFQADKLSDVLAVVYEPSGDFSSKVAKPPRLSLGHYVLTALRTKLKSDSKMHLHKSAYWFNVYSGEPYFKFVRHKFGPYAPSLEVMVVAIRDFRDYYKLDTLALLDDGFNRSLSGRDVVRLKSWDQYIEEATSLCNRYVGEIELLATTHAVIREHGPLNEESIIGHFFDWSEEKAKNFQPKDVVRSIDLLSNESLISRELHGYVASTRWRVETTPSVTRGDFDPLRH